MDNPTHLPSGRPLPHEAVTTKIPHSTIDHYAEDVAQLHGYGALTRHIYKHVFSRAKEADLEKHIDIWIASHNLPPRGHSGLEQNKQKILAIIPKPGQQKVGAFAWMVHRKVTGDSWSFSQEALSYKLKEWEVDEGFNDLVIRCGCIFRTKTTAKTHLKNEHQLSRYPIEWDSKPTEDDSLDGAELIENTGQEYLEEKHQELIEGTARRHVGTIHQFHDGKLATNLEEKEKGTNKSFGSYREFVSWNQLPLFEDMKGKELEALAQQQSHTQQDEYPRSSDRALATVDGISFTPWGSARETSESVDKILNTDEDAKLTTMDKMHEIDNKLGVGKRPMEEEEAQVGAPRPKRSNFSVNELLTA
ncbi:hypothetical protein HYALB_00012564 [Hymenoscyphus albidus]|uniref:Uncharacterized protein n=1 Tax=Hymenoscyphus albidus TaxID=595503 RepID=A0A9N9PZ39_9HELO|nr:hypothetical protein HYALB_00012564 [Hymenoscyphus albidus]